MSSDDDSSLFFEGIILGLVLGICSGIALIKMSQLAPYQLAEQHCRASGYSSGWYDGSTGRIRCVMVTEAK